MSAIDPMRRTNAHEVTSALDLPALPNAVMIAVRGEDVAIGVLLLIGASELEPEVSADLAAVAASELRLGANELQQRERRQQADTRYRHLFETSHDAIYMTTRDGVFLEANG